MAMSVLAIAVEFMMKICWNLLRMLSWKTNISSDYNDVVHLDGVSARQHTFRHFIKQNVQLLTASALKVCKAQGHRLQRVCVCDRTEEITEWPASISHMFGSSAIGIASGMLGNRRCFQVEVWKVASVEQTHLPLALSNAVLPRFKKVNSWRRVTVKYQLS